MTEPGIAFRWSLGEFVRASEAGAFDHRVELIDGEIWSVVIDSWHGDTVKPNRCIASAIRCSVERLDAANR